MRIRDTALFTDANLQGYWELENNLNDSSPNGYTLTNHGSTDTASGRYLHGRSFVAASSQYASIANASCPNLEISGSQSWVCWVKQSTLTSYQIPMGKVSGASPAHGLITSNDSGGIVYFSLTGLTTNTQVNSGVAVLDTGNWHHLAGVYDASAQKLRIYIDGVKVGEVTASGSADNTGLDFGLGASGGGASFTDGLIDDAAIFNRALTDVEIATLYSGASESPSISPSPSLSPSSSASASSSASLSPSPSLSPSGSASSSPSSSSSQSASSSASNSASSSPSEGFEDYTREESAILPLDDSDLATTYSAQEKVDVSFYDGSKVGQEGKLDYMIHQFKIFVHTDNGMVLYKGQSTLAPSISPVFLQIYNQIDHVWETIDRNSTSDALTDFALRKYIRDFGNYKNGNIVSCRIYQLSI